MAGVDGRGDGLERWVVPEGTQPQVVATGAVLFATLEMPRTVVRIAGRWPGATAPTPQHGSGSVLTRLGCWLLGR